MSVNNKQQPEQNLTFRAFKDGEHKWDDWQEAIFSADHSHKCPTYVHRTPPCQGSCPSGEDIRGWLQIVRGIEKPPPDMGMGGIRLSPQHRRQSFPVHDGAGLPGPLRGRMQPQ